MKLWLSRMRDGRYTLSLLKPSLCRLKGTTEKDFYLQHGDPVGMLRAICQLGVEMVNPDCAMEPLAEPIRVEVTMKKIEGD